MFRIKTVTGRIYIKKVSIGIKMIEKKKYNHKAEITFKGSIRSKFPKENPD